MTTPTLFAAGLPFPEGPCFDRHGNLHVADTGLGAILRVEPDGTWSRVADAFAGPNDLAFDAAGTSLYLAHTRAGRVDRFSVDADGRLSKGEVFAEVSPVDHKGGCDGVAFDVEGRLYVALFRFGVVRVLAPDGSRERDISIAGDRPTNVAFGGSDRRTLFITEVETSSVYTLPVPAPGLPLFAERAWARAGIA